MIGCLEAENTTDGLLEDVETIINSYYNESHLEEPIVWVTQHPATANRQADLSQTMELTVPFEFDCGVYEADLEESNLASQNLANRVIMSILNNWQTIQATELPGQRLIRNITLQTYSPVGYVNVTNKSDKVAVTGEIRTGSYVNKDGQKVYTTDVIVENFQFLDTKGSRPVSDEDSSSDVTPYDFSNGDATSSSDDPFADFGAKIEVSDSELPF